MKNQFTYTESDGNQYTKIPGFKIEIKSKDHFNKVLDLMYERGWDIYPIPNWSENKWIGFDWSRDEGHEVIWDDEFILNVEENNAEQGIDNNLFGYKTVDIEYLRSQDIM